MQKQIKIINNDIFVIVSIKFKISIKISHYSIEEIHLKSGIPRIWELIVIQALKSTQIPNIKPSGTVISLPDTSLLQYFKFLDRDLCQRHIGLIRLYNFFSFELKN